MKPWVGVLRDAAIRMGPVRWAFTSSLLLSWIAVSGNPVLNRDGMLYVEMAQSIAGAGLVDIKGSFIFLAVLPAFISLVSIATGLPPEISAHVVDAALLAGACGLIVSIVRQRMPEAAWAACLVVLAMPAYNGYRDQVLREYGFWFFSLLAIWLAMQWEANSWRWREALLCQGAVLCAVLFRQEAVAYFPALMLWQICAAPRETRLKRVLAIGFLPVIGTVITGIVVITGVIPLPDRLAYFLNAVNPVRALQEVGEAARKMSDVVFKYKYSREEAGYVLFFGLLTIIPMKFLKMSGVLLFPLIYAFWGHSVRVVINRWQVVGWFFFAHVAVLVAFVTYQFFLVGRYVAMLNLLAVPVVAVGVTNLMQRFPRWRLLVIVLALLSMLANVISTSPTNTQIIDAGKWLAANVPDPDRVYVDNPRVAYYGKLGYVRAGLLQRELPTAADALLKGQFDMFVLDLPRKNTETMPWLARSGLDVVKEFVGPDGNAIIVAVPRSIHNKPFITERHRSNADAIE
jgi:hypothetical protein